MSALTNFNSISEIFDGNFKGIGNALCNILKVPDFDDKDQAANELTDIFM